MIIIFGTKNISKNYGVVEKIECPHCHNTEFWHYIKSRSWFTLFWIPIFPISGAKHFIICPICERILYVEAQNRENYKKLAELNSDYMNGKVTDEEYENLMKEIN